MKKGKNISKRIISKEFILKGLLRQLGLRKKKGKTIADFAS
jgi:hypothetical protein